MAQNYVTFAYDNYGGEKIVVRGIRLLDYTAGGPDFKPGDFSLVDPKTTATTADDDMRPMFSLCCCEPEFWARVDIGGNDEVHGETGDDFIYVGGGFDIAFGDADDDDIIGGWGHDWISGGTGQDGILGDDGRIFTSRNTSDPSKAENLYGVLALLASDPDTRTSQGDVLNELITTPGDVQVETINVAGQLKKSVDLTPFNLTEAELGAANPLLVNPMFADDVIFGGLGKDFLHGGSGDDAISGAEAIGESYAPRFDSLGNLVGLIRHRLQPALQSERHPALRRRRPALERAQARAEQDRRVLPLQRIRSAPGHPVRWRQRDRLDRPGGRPGRLPPINEDGTTAWTAGFSSTSSTRAATRA